MKNALTMAVLLLCGTAAAQTLNVQMDEVTYQIPAAQAGKMTYNDGSTLTILGKDYALNENLRMYIDLTQVTDNTVGIAYNGSTAAVTVAGNIARYLTIAVNGAHVSIVQSDDVADEITYTLCGTASDGSFTLAGSYKTAIDLNGLTLTNPHGAAIDIQNGKRIAVSAKSGTVNTLTDGAAGTQKGCFACKGHTEFKGKGTLNIHANAAHGIWSKEYVEMKNCTINVLSAPQDGINCNQYFRMESGTLTIDNCGDDGIQVSYKDDGTDPEDTGSLTIVGGTLTIGNSGAASKSIKTDASVTIDGGDLTLRPAGTMTIENNDASYSSGIKTTDFVQNDGTLQITATGTASRGISANTITTNGGMLTISNSGAGQTVSNENYTAKGLNADTAIALNAGTVSIAMTGTGGKGIKSSGTYTQGTADGEGPLLTISTSGSRIGGSSGGGGGRPGGGGPGGWNPGGNSSSGSSAKAIKAQGRATLYGGETTITTLTDGAEGLESKTAIYIEGGQHYFACYDDCINSSGKIFFNGGVTVCYSNGNDAVDSNANTTGAITIGNGIVLAYTTAGGPEEGLDCDNNSYIQITGTGIAISTGGSQGGGSGWGGSSGNTISNAAQGYAFVTSSIAYAANRYYTLATADGTNLVTYSFPASVSSSLALFTATGMVKNNTYNVKYSTTAPTDATTAFHGLYLGSSHTGTTSVTSFTAK